MAERGVGEDIAVFSLSLTVPESKWKAPAANRELPVSPDQREYYRTRAIEERVAAATASAVAAEIHLELACLYEKLVELDERPPDLTLVRPERLSA